MPTFNDPAADAEEARQAMRGLAHASQRIEDPDELYGIVGELLGTARSLEQSLIQLSGGCLTHQGRAAHDDGDKNLGAADAWAAADALRQAARHISDAEAVLDQASGHLGRIAWRPAAAHEGRWVNIAYIDSPLAKQIIGLLHLAGPESIIERLQRFDGGAASDEAAVEAGQVYDVPPTNDPDDQRFAQGSYVLIINEEREYVALYREYTPPPQTEGAGGAAAMSGAGPAQGAANAEAVRRALEERRDRVRGDGSWFTPDRIAEIKRDRGLGR
ncbi:hypothetical protein CGZ94_20295 [Enemella evansiae]|uniref:Uncharacterized protein n=1 Tax=Enemella evansiae TaxID=2016499 RepID=A0A255FYR7_9ACTN|nr:hypothetical protein [Enemella evansiae]OYO08837.1 hypothetical protein CGZ94_20295 [Enemella evansiae]